MKTRTVPLSRFRLAEFLASYTAFHRRWSRADALDSVGVYVLDKLGDTPVPSNRELDIEAEPAEELTKARTRSSLALHDGGLVAWPDSRIHTMTAGALNGQTLEQLRRL